MDRKLPPLTALRAFEAAARHAAVGKAARELNVTHAAVSQQLRQLEDWLGVPLFRREGRSIALTPEGDAYFSAVRDGFDRMSEATRTLTASREGRPVDITTTAAFASRWLMPRLPRFYAKHPDVRIRVDSVRTLVDLRTQPVDLAIRFGKGDWPDLEVEPLIGAELAPLCAPSYIERIGLKSPADLPRAHVFHDGDYSEWEHWLAMAGYADVDVRTNSTVITNLILGYQAALDGQGVVLGVESLTRDDVDAGRLVFPFGISDEARGYWIVRRRGAVERPAAAAFRTWLVEEAAAGA